MIEGLTVPLWVYATAGVLILWSKSKASNRGVYGLSDLIDRFIPEKYAKTRSIVEVICYLSIGCLLSMGVFNPATPAQALAAGLGWTGLTTR
jgi:hypothetical protein